jgi:hypothetical protein
MSRIPALILATGLLCSCGGVKPTGALGDVIDGKIFEKSSVSKEQQAKNEANEREHARQTPPPADPGGVQFRIPL